MTEPTPDLMTEPTSGVMTEPTPRAGLMGTGRRGRPEWVYYGRYERRLTIAHPDHRAALAAELEEHVLNGAVT